MAQLAISCPEVTTKNLALNVVGDKRKVRVSSNFLEAYSLVPETRIKVVPNKKPLSGFEVVPDLFGALKVYKRSYSNRQRANNPHEAVVEVASQKLLDQTIPAYTQRVHIEMRNGKLAVVPLKNRVHSIHTRMKSAANVQTAFVALTGGVDAYMMEDAGFSVEAVVEYRPDERRDISSGRSLTEVNALNVLRNCQPRMLLNEDIFEMDMDIFGRLVEELPPIGVFVVSAACDDFSNLKNKGDKAKSLDDLSTTVDQVFPLLNQIEKVQPATVLLENVPGFLNSNACDIFVATLRRKGYFVTASVLNSLDFGARQQRKRCYVHASISPGFAWPEPTGRRTDTLEDVIKTHVADCRDITDTSVMATRAKKEAAGRAMPPVMTKDTVYCGTVTKSQSRMISDGQYFEHDGRIYTPSEAMLKELMSIPQDFDVSRATTDTATEILGQSLDGCTHAAVTEAMNKHLAANFGNHRVVSHRIKRARA